MNNTILFVDDDKSLLKSFHRLLSHDFKIVTASRPESGLRIFQEQGPFPVIVSDMKMPGMDGIELLSRVKEIRQDTVCILLTGYADQQTAIDAVNRGTLFRFLTKPCGIELMTEILNDGLRQYQLTIAEKELLELTLFGTVKVLSQVLTLVNPIAQGFAGRLKRYCRHIAVELNLEEDQWLYEIAAMLSQLGCLTLPPELLSTFFNGGRLEGSEKEMVAKHPLVAGKLLMHIPRLEEITEIVALQDKPCSFFPRYEALENYTKVQIGAQMLHIAIGIERMLMRGISPERAVGTLIGSPEEYNSLLVEPLQRFDFGLQNMVRMSIHSSELTMQMTLDEDIYTGSGVLLAPKGQQVTEALAVGMKNYATSVGINEPFTVLVPILDFDI